eukprot:CAMPEP_0197035178 /NCGR_PEP_ID=MMETSP1384-20130603/13042_1 /TAXON_ID=29189 /ORGANISM="Ammonia sp." /LENGTH=289 /DNA_ID=CAMNT_0042465205 /DNA_START=39 /DNA_END=905 /DNA_ORIENTATION=+
MALLTNNLFLSILCLGRVFAGEWLLLLHQDTDEGGFFDASIKSTGVSNPALSDSALFSIIGYMDRDALKNSESKYQLRLRYNNGESSLWGGKAFDAVWTQTSWVTDKGITGSSIMESPYNPFLGTPGYQDYECAEFKGIGLSDHVRNYLDGNGWVGQGTDNCGWTFHPAGQIDEYIGADCIGGMPVDFPNYENCAAIADLFVCVGGDCDLSSEEIKCGANADGEFLGCDLASDGDTCSLYGLGLPQKHACECKAECGAAFCNSNEKVEEILGVDNVPDAELCASDAKPF